MKVHDLSARIAKRFGRVARCAKPATSAAILAGGLMFAGPANAQIFSENFDGLTLGPLVSSSESGGDGTDWTDVPPAGWTRDNGSTPGDGPAEFFGFTFFDRDAWVTTAEDQERSQFTLGTGNVMVADPDEYDDLGDIDPDLFNVFMTTPTIGLSGQAANSLTVDFDSSFRPYDGMTGLVDVSYDGGGSWTNLLTLDTATLGGNSLLDRVNESVSLPASNPDSGDMLVRFGMINAGNDWWWAVDNLQVNVIPEPTSAGMVGVGAVAAAAFVRRRRKK